MIKYEKSGTTSFALGTTLTFELFKTRPELIKRLYISEKQKRDDTYHRLLALAKENHVAVIENNKKIFKDLSQKDNTMVVAEFAKFEDDLSKEHNHVVLVNPSNMGNLGTIIRSCVGFGINDLVIIRPASDLFDPKVVRASMGALFHIRYRLYDDFAQYEKDHPSHHLYPFMLQAKTALHEVKIQSPWSIIFGNEATGLPASFLEKGTPVLIPHTPYIDSLNLDNAAAIGIYEFAQKSDFSFFAKP